MAFDLFVPAWRLKKAGEEDEPAGQKVGWAGGCRRLDNAREEGHVRVGRRPPLGRPPTCSALLLVVWSTRRDGHSNLPARPARPTARALSLCPRRSRDGLRGDRGGGDDDDYASTMEDSGVSAGSRCPSRYLGCVRTWSKAGSAGVLWGVCICVSVRRRHMSWSARGRVVMIGSWPGRMPAGKRRQGGGRLAAWPARPCRPGTPATPAAAIEAFLDAMIKGFDKSDRLG